MGMKIDSVIKNAVAGVQQGLNKAQKNSAQLAMANSGPSEAGAEGDRKVAATAQTVKSADPDLGKLVDVEA
ncbi:MAG: hypothetical protein OEY89_01570 [Gammaproteobacteria bacterium]|nr:hypothetical protein [Gammaproteobacteria bacterium]